ncbi:uncharacterized protein HGUI_03481 [Hanseniaspora guilliermondii]|uniref:Vacuolar protein sorting-associated protein 54 C-terminal domain-containing protein n=1 Tax=Hanseniaspora guilliermondii TaxID=56406 RepID=A0A1L0CRU8_9ASCO|nr:uncharacterized protein HGUI_03481 [Hanseniaspora guilliermondii]
MNEQSGLMAAPIMTKGQSEMITFRKSIDTRPSRSVLSSPKPMVNNKDISEKLKDKPFINKQIDTSAVDSYSPILNQKSRDDEGMLAGVNSNKNVDFFDDDNNDYTNSIYQTIMNMENKHWFQRPATYEIPQTKLSSNNEDDFMSDDSWRDELKAYLNNVGDLIEEYESIKNDNIKNTTDDVEISVSEANILEAFKDDKFNLKDMYYKNKLKSFGNGDDQMLLKRLKGMLFKIENIHKKYISSHTKEIQNSYKDILDIKKQLLHFEKLIHEEINKTNKTLQEDIITEETYLNMKLKLNNIQRLENELVNIDSLIDKITALCDKYHMECEENENLLAFENLEKYLKDINELDDELNKNVLFERVPLLKAKRDILMNLKLEVGGKLRLQFVKILESDLESYHNNQFKDPSTILNIMDADADWPELKFEPSFKTVLNGYVDNLCRNDLLITAYKMYCDRIINKCRELVKDSLPKPKEDEPVVVKMSQLIVNMTPLEFNNLVDYVLSTSLIYFKRLYEQQKLLLDLGINALDKNPSMQNEALDSSYFLKLDIRAGINESIRIVQLRMAKIITCRSSINARLNYKNFLKLRLTMCNFSRQCEQLTGEILTINLNDVIVVHTEEYQKLLCERLNKRVRTFVEQREDWMPTIVTADIQKSVNEIFLSNEIIPDDWYITMTTSLDNKTNTSGDKKSIVINEKTYVSSATLIEVIKIIKEVLIVSNNLPVKYMHSLEYGLLKILADFDRVSLKSLISNPSILNTNTLGSSNNGNNTQNNSFFVNLNNNHNININSIIFKDKEKNYTILSETLECIKEIIPKIKAYFNGKTKNSGTKMVNNTKMIVNPNQGRLKTNKFYDNIMINYDRTAGLIFRSNIPPPSEDTPDESLTKVAQRKSLDESKEPVNSKNQDVKTDEPSNDNENTETKEKNDEKIEVLEDKELMVEESNEDVGVKEDEVV